MMSVLVSRNPCDLLVTTFALLSIARRGIESSTRLGRFRWVVERTLAWLYNHRRLTIRHERHDDTHQTLLTLGAIMICRDFVHQSFCQAL